MSVSSQSNNALPDARWLGVPVGALVGAVTALLVGVVFFPIILLFIALAEGQW